MTTKKQSRKMYNAESINYSYKGYRPYGVSQIAIINNYLPQDYTGDALPYLIDTKKFKFVENGEQAILQLDLMAVKFVKENKEENKMTKKANEAKEVKTAETSVKPQKSAKTAQNAPTGRTTDNKVKTAKTTNTPKQKKASEPLEQASFAGIPYKGKNQEKLAAIAEERNYQSNIWVTFLEAQKMGRKIIKGQKSVAIEHYKWYSKEELAQAKEKGEEGYQPKPFRVYFANVFNLEQTEIRQAKAA